MVVIDGRNWVRGFRRGPDESPSDEVSVVRREAAGSLGVSRFTHRGSAEVDGAQRSVKDRRSASRSDASTQCRRELPVGRGAYVGPGVGWATTSRSGLRARLATRLGNGVFIRPAAVLTNGLYPRAVGRAVSSGHLGLGAGGRDVGDGAAIGARRWCGRLDRGCWALVRLVQWSC